LVDRARLFISAASSMVLVALRYSRAYDRGLGFQAPRAGCSVIASMVLHCWDQ
jgi:hypothetical protein